MLICDRCYQDETIGEHGVNLCPLEPRRANAVHQDSVEGGFFAENGFSQPTWFESKKAHRDALAAKGLEVAAKWAGPNDKHLKRWDVPSAATLESARILLSRKKSTPFASDAELAEFPITVTDITFQERH